MNSYELSRRWFDYCFENPELINPNHTAIYFFAIEHCNRLGWKKKFGFPSQMTMDALGIKKHQTYIKYFNDIITWGGFTLIQKSKNQYSANIISINAMPKNGKALDKALIKHAAKQTESNGQSNSSINKQRTINKEQIVFSDFWDLFHTITNQPKTDKEATLKYWDKLSNKEKQKAIDNVKPYYESLPVYSSGKPVKKARTYLNDKNFNDEFSLNKQNEIRASKPQGFKGYK